MLIPQRGTEATSSPSSWAAAPPQALSSALSRFQRSTGIGRAISPAVITALADHGSAALWLTLATATLLSPAAVAT